MAAWWRGLLAVFLAALVLRGAFVATRSADLAWPDAQEYDAIARRLLAEGVYREDLGRQASRAPGYPLFVAGCYAARLTDPRAVFALQALAGAAACVVVALLGRRMFDERVGLLAGWIAALDPFAIYFSGTLLSETLFTLGLAGYVLLLLLLLDARNLCRGLWLAVAAGALAGGLTLLRSSFLFFPFFVIPFAALTLWRRNAAPPSLQSPSSPVYPAPRPDTRHLTPSSDTGHPTPPVSSGVPVLRCVMLWAVMIVVMILALTPWTVRNYRIFARVVPTTLQVGESLYEAFSPYADGGPAMDRIDWPAVRGGPMGELENNDFFKKAAVKYVREHPARAGELAVEKARRFWNVVPNHGPHRSGAYVAISLAAVVPVYLLALAGLCCWRGGGFWLLVSPVIYFAVMHMVFVGSVRYRVPVMPFLGILAAAGAVWLWSRRKASSAKERKSDGPLA